LQGANVYVFPGVSFLLGRSPFAFGSVFLRPEGTLPTVTSAGLYDVPFEVGGSFCVTDDPNVLPPSSGPGCFSVTGSAMAHYRVIETNTPNAFFQPLPTIEILAPTHMPEPGTWLVGLPLFAFLVYRIRMRSAG
jgi:hypothetical protein